MFSRRTEWTLTANHFTQVQREVMAAGRPWLDLMVSNPTRTGLYYDTEAILRSLSNSAALDYDPQPKGLRNAREAVAGYYLGYGDVDPESLILTTSTSEGYSYVFRLLCNPGDELLVPKPSYPLFEFLADLLDLKLVPYPLLYDHAWQVDLHSLEKAVSPLTRAVVVVHPNNPTGSFVSQSERITLNALCRERALALVVDEVFLDYVHQGGPRSSFVSNTEALTFTLSGLSKISALPQMKLAWIVASGPSELVHAALERSEMIADTYLSQNAPIQLAAQTLLDQRTSIQPQLMERIRANLKALDGQLSRQTVCQRLEVEGGWYVVLRVPVTQADEDLAIDLLRTASVLVHPGHFYDFPADGYLVLSLITPVEQFREGLRQILEMVGRVSR